MAKKKISFLGHFELRGHFWGCLHCLSFGGVGCTLSRATKLCRRAWLSCGGWNTCDGLSDSEDWIDMPSHMVSLALLEYMLLCRLLFYILYGCSTGPNSAIIRALRELAVHIFTLTLWFACRRIWLTLRYSVLPLGFLMWKCLRPYRRMSCLMLCFDWLFITLCGQPST